MLSTARDVSTKLRYESLASEMGPISEFFNDETVNEIMVNADSRIYIERSASGMSLADATMAPHQTESLLKTVAAIMQCKLGPDQPSIQGHLAGGVRIQGLLPPVVDEPILAIRKPSPVTFTLEQLEEQGVLPLILSQRFDGSESSFAERWRTALARQDRPLSLREKLKLASDLRANFLIGGPTGSGKTAIAKAVYEHLVGRRSDGSERLLVIQDTVEIQPRAPNQVSIRAEAGWVFTPREAVLAAMRLRPDRIIVGEIRDGRAALELLKAWNTGHPGGLSTIHGDNAPGLLDRFAQLLEEVVYPAPRRLIAQTVNVLLYIERDARIAAGRAITAAAVVEGVDPDGSWRLASL
jgi:type IV secretion system protein TrbB